MRTDLIVSEIVSNGFDSERGPRAIARMLPTNIPRADYPRGSEIESLGPPPWHRQQGHARS